MRKLEKEMEVYLDKKLEKNGLAQQAFKSKDARTLFRLAAEACVGIQEATGRNDGKMVMLIQGTVGGASGEPWCAALVMTCLAYAEKKTGLKSPIAATELCLAMWNDTPKEHRVKLLPLAGAIAVWNDVGKTTGHTEIVLSCDGKAFQAIGGNTSGSTNPNTPLNREGNGVFYTVRSMKSTPKRKLLGFLKPFPAVGTATIPAPTPTLKADWKNEEWTGLLVDSLNEYGEKLLKQNSVQYWVMLFSSLARLESGFDPKCTYIELFKDKKGEKVVSRGLFQISIESANGYPGVKLKSALELHDPEVNIRTAVIIANTLFAKDGMVWGGDASKGWKGLARYWSQFRKPEKIEAMMKKVRAAV